MAYLVNLTIRAERDLAILYRHINAEDSDAALKWYRGLKEAILSLEGQPNRCPVTPQSDKFRKGELKVLRGGSWGEAPMNVRVSIRGRDASEGRSSTFGVRCAINE